MKFLAIYKYHTRPPADKFKDMVAETSKLSQEWKARGKIECSYQIVPTGSVVIYDVDSHEELLEIMNTGPLVPYLKRKVKPLSDSQYSLDMILKS